MKNIESYEYKLQSEIQCNSKSNVCKIKYSE